MPDGFDLLYEDGPCLMVHKPGGVLTQAPAGVDSLEVRIKRFLKARGSDPPIYLGVPHRLDRPVSGVLVVATTKKATRRIAEQFEGRIAQKKYWALVEGGVEPSAGTWTDWMRKIPGKAHSEIVQPDHPQGRIAILHYRVLQQDERICWLEIELETGRTHQIRLQAGSRGLPVLGDQQYGSQAPFGPSTSDERLRWIALHARSLAIRHPKSREEVCVTAPLPEPWRPHVDRS